MKPIYEVPLASLAARCSALEAELAALKRLVSAAALVTALSGTVDAHFVSLSGSVNSAIQTISGGGLTFVSTDQTISGSGIPANPLSIVPVSSSIDGSIKNSYSVLQSAITGTNNTVTNVSNSVTTLSGTVDAHFASLSGTLDSGIKAAVHISGTVYSGLTGSVLFVGPNQILADDPGGMFWDQTNRRLGLGVVNPSAAPLHIRGGVASGVSPVNPSLIVVESSGSAYISVNGGAGQDKALVFNNPSNTADGALVYDNGLLPRGLQVRTGGNNTNLTVDVTGTVTIWNNVLNMNSHRVNNVVDPASAQDAATKNYVDVLSGSVNSATNHSNGVFNIKFYGAKGDGATDDTAAIQAALDAAGAVSGTVVVPAQGTAYRFSNLKLSPYTKLRGEHMWLSRLQRIPGSTGVAIREKTVAEGNPVGATGIWIQDLFVDGNNTLGDGINLGNQTANFALSTMAGIQNVASWYFVSGSGFKINSNADAFHYLWADHNATGVYFGGGGANVIHSLYAEFNSVYDIQINDFGTSVHGVQIETNSSASAHLRVEGLQNSFYGIYFGLGANAGTLISNAPGANRNSYYSISVAANGWTYVDTVRHEAWALGTGPTASLHSYVIGEGSGDTADYYINGSTAAVGYRSGDNTWFPGGVKLAYLNNTGDTKLNGSLTGSGQALLTRGSTGLAGLGYELLVLENNSDAVLMFKGSSVNEKSIYYTNPSGTADGGIVYDNPGTPRGFQFRTGGNATRFILDSNGVATMKNNVFITGTLNVNQSNAGATLSVRPANNNTDGIFMDQAGGYTASMVYEGTNTDFGGWGLTFKMPSAATTQVDLLKLRGDRRVYVSGALLVSGSADVFQMNVHKDLIVSGSSYVAGNLYTTGNLVVLGQQVIVGSTRYEQGVTAELLIQTVSGANINSDGQVSAKAGYATGPSGSTGQLYLSTTIYTGSQVAGSAQQVYNWIPNPGTQTFTIRMVGGGGGGAGAAASSAGAGGGSGLYWESTFMGAIILNTPLKTGSLYVGSGGVTGSAGGGTGGTGGDTVFSFNNVNYVTKGGIGGTAGTAPGGALGTGWTTSARGITAIIAGEPGDGSIVATGGSLAGKGGNNPLGVGGATSAGAGVAGRGFGGGGGGGTNNTAGGSGSWGAIIIDEYG